MHELPINRRGLIWALAGCCLTIAGCGKATTVAVADAREGGGTPTLFDNPPMGDPLAPSQVELNSRRPARATNRPQR